MLCHFFVQNVNKTADGDYDVRCPLDVVAEMEYDERLALFRQTRLNPFDRGEEDDGPQGGRTPLQHGNVYNNHLWSTDDAGVCYIYLNQISVFKNVCFWWQKVLDVQS